MADQYEGPIEDEAWLGVRKARVPGDAALSRRLIGLGDGRGRRRLRRGMALRPRHRRAAAFPDAALRPESRSGQHQLPGPPLTPLKRAWTSAARSAAPSIRCPNGSRSWEPAASRIGRRHRTRERSTRPGTRDFLERWTHNDRARLLAYTDADTYRDAGQGGFEIRTFISVAAAAGGAGELWYYQPIPIFAVGCTVAVMQIA